MPDAGFLEEQVPLPSAPETPPTPVDEDEVALAERQAVAEEEAQQETFLEQAVAEAVAVTPEEQAGGVTTATTTTTATPIATPAQDAVAVEVEKILEEGLQNYYQELPKPAQERFRAKGVETTLQISTMVRSLHVQVKKVLSLIRDWLLTIPGVNKFFLEQEAKIKTDRIVELERVRREEQQHPS